VSLGRVGELLVGLFDRVQEHVDVGILATDQPDHDAFVVTVIPRQDSVDCEPVDRDVLGVVGDRRDDRQFDLGVRWLVSKDVDQFAYEHGSSATVQGFD
jgi:hypothetical protein